MKNLVIIGARAFGREVYNLALQSIGYEEDFIVKGFLDSKTDALNSYEGYPNIIGEPDTYEPKPGDVFICALGDVKYKKKYVEMLLAKGAEFTSLIHKESAIERNTKIGKGCIVCRWVNISCDTEIGDFVTFQPFTDIGHDVKIGNYCHMNAHSFLGGFVVVEDEATINTGAIIHPHKKVGTQATVGAGSLVLRNVKSGTTVLGVPAKLLEI